MSEVFDVREQSQIQDWSEFVNPILKALPPSGIRRFFDLVSEMKDVVSLGVGEPDFVTPRQIIDACIRSLDNGQTGYTSNQGMLELREAISEEISGSYGVKYDPKSEILITVGVSEGLDLAMRALVSPGDEVLIPEPTYVSYIPCAALAYAKTVPLKTNMDKLFRVTADQVEKAITPRSKILLLAYPNNPTGAIMTRKELLDICEVVKAHNLIVISDEIYEHLSYIEPHTCVSSLPGMKERTILLSGFSKSYAMTGWRAGYACGNPDFIGAMTKIHQYSMLCAPTQAQVCALEALKSGKPDMRRMTAEYNKRRKLVIEAMADMGLPCFEPGGAFYAFPDITKTGMIAAEFSERLLAEEKVAVVDGTAFGEAGEGHVRISYAYSVEKLTEAFKRMSRFVKKYSS